MNVLYLTEDYFASKVHNSLIVKELAQDSNLHVYVFSPVRDVHRKSLSSSFDEHKHLFVVAPKIDINTTRYRVDFWEKVRCKVRLIEENIPITQIDCIHAATLYSEGAVAYELKKKYNIPYLVSIRGCDAVTYTNRFPHLWHYGNLVLRNAKVVVSVTPSIKERMLESWQYILSKKQLNDSLVINNGIDDIWIDQANNEISSKSFPFKIIYIGRFDKNKNVLRLIKAVKACRKNYDIRLVLVGGNGNEHNKVIEEIDKENFIEYLGEIYDKQILLQTIRSCNMFAMVSHSETFGLVYAECLTQGLPIIYSVGTGFDKMYPQAYVGYSADSYSVWSISRAIESVIANYQSIVNNISQIDFSIFSWSQIIYKYLDCYSQMNKK